MLDDQSIETTRLFRVEQTYAVKTGRWYFEFEAVTGGDMRVGWARPGCRPDVELGGDDQAFVFDGYRVNQLCLHILYYFTSAAEIISPFLLHYYVPLMEGKMTGLATNY